MATLTIAPATGAVSRFNVELRDDGDDGRQIGLILDDHAGIEEVGLTIGTTKTRHVDDPIHPFGWRRGAIGRCVTFVPAGFLGMGLEISSAEGSRLAMGCPPGLGELLPKAAVLSFQFGEAVLELGKLALQASDGAIPFGTAGASGEYHDKRLSDAEKREGSKVRCRGAILMVRPESRISLERKSARR
jgi:hypothetical protein